MNQGNYATTVAGVCTRTHNGEKLLQIIMLAFSLIFLSATTSFGQKVQKGHERKKGEMNFSEVSKYFKAHPQKLKRMELENEEDEEKRPDPQPVSDPSLIRTRRAEQKSGEQHGSANGANAHVSNAPTALFESTLDNGTTVPPDTHGAVDSNYCITTINSTVKIQTRAGAAVSSVTLNQFWLPVLSSGGAFDPRAHYDPYANRWFIVSVSGANSTASSILIAVSKTSNPTSGWWMYKIQADPAGSYWLDFPNVGLNKKWLTVTGNLFGSAYGGAKVFIFDKAALMSGTGAPFTAFTQTSSFTICPAITYDNTLENLFAVESWNGASGYMRLWKISGAVGSESMTTVSYPANANKWRNAGGSSSTADFAPQLGITNKIQTNDDRVTQMIFMNNKLWFAHTVFLPYNISSYATRSAVQWWQTDTTGTPLQIGRVDDSVAGNFYAFPSIAVNTMDDAVIGFSLFSSSIYPSAGYTLRMHTDPIDAMGSVQVYKPGQSSYYKTYGGSRNRWGDYSSTCLDPLNKRDFWTVQEVASATANVWDTWWANISVSGCSVAAISGATTICTGSSATLTDATTGGTWASSNTAVATVSTSGVVSAITAGTATITYATTPGCSATATITVTAAPSAIGGNSTLCAGTTTTLTNTATGGTWSSSNAAVAAVGSAAGIVSGAAAGTATITYATGVGCYATKAITVNTAPAAISGTIILCAGNTAALTDATTGGSWSSGNTAVATISSTGMVSAIAPGTATVTYATSGCATTTTVTVNASPAAISGNSSLCAGTITTLTNSVTGGTWSSSNPSAATVGTSTGVVSGVAAGTATITYSTGTGCNATKTITVNAAPGSVAGATTLCTGTTSTLSNAAVGGTWSSSNTAVATAGATTGIVSGVAAGTSVISYTTAGGCYVTAIVTVNSSASAGTISGSSSVSTGATTSFTSTATGGTWSSSNSAIATVNMAGVVTGVAAGTANISYSVSNTCGTAYAVKTVTVTPVTPTNATPVFVGGASQAMTTCQNSAAKSITTLLAASDLDAGQTETWSVVSSPSHGTLAGFSTSITSTGSTLTPSGLTYQPTTGYSGSDAFTIKVSDGLASSTIVINVIVTPTPVAGAISGSSNITIGVPVTYTSSGTPGGTWTSSNTAIATVGATSGTANGVTSGSAVISYTVSNACGSSTSTIKVRVKATTGTGHGSAAPVTLGDAPPVQGATVYPNPVRSTFTLDAPVAGKFYLFDANGNLIAEYKVDAGANALTMKRNMQPGIYIGKYTGDDGSSSSVRIVYEP